MIGLEDPTPKEMLKAWREYHTQIEGRLRRSEPGAERAVLKYLNEMICPDERKFWSDKMKD